jgi:hypothetical protein
MSEQDEVGQALRALPRATIPMDYTERVMARVRHHEVGYTKSTTRRSHQIWLAAATVIGIGWMWMSGPSSVVPSMVSGDAPALTVTEIASLKAEMDAMRAELESMQRQPQRRVIAVPGDHGSDVLMDFRPVRFTGPGGQRDTRIQPARFERVMGVTP